MSCSSLALWVGSFAATTAANASVPVTPTPTSMAPGAGDRVGAAAGGQDAVDAAVEEAQPRVLNGLRSNYGAGGGDEVAVDGAECGGS